MPLQNTNLLIQLARIPPTFKGTPDEFAQLLVRRMKIVSPTGTNFIFIGDVEPSSNVGPWLKGGTQWWVFDAATKRYVPLDISESETKWFQVGNTTPTTSDPPVWLKTTKDQTEADPSIGQPISWHVFDGTNWIPFDGVVRSGPTASRPSGAVEFQKFYDTDITVLLWWERGQWRTVSGVPGDVKQVAFETLTEAIARNPGWDVFGASNQAFRGRVFVQAAKDPGASPATSLTVGAGITPRAAFETFGESTPLTSAASAVTLPAQIALWTLVKG